MEPIENEMNNSERIAKLEAAVAGLRALLLGFQPLEAGPEKERALVARIMSAVAAHYGLPVGALTGKRREAVVVWPRHLAIYLARELTELSWLALVRPFHRDRTALIYAHESVGRRMEFEALRRAEVESWLGEFRKAPSFAGPTEGGEKDKTKTVEAEEEEEAEAERKDKTT